MERRRDAQVPRTVWSGVYSKLQADRGGQAYRTHCGYCHRDDLRGGFMDDGVGRAPALAGPQAFGSSIDDRWRDQSLGDVVYTIASSMPKQAPTSLSLDTYLDIVAYLLQENDAPAGPDDLIADIPALREIQVTTRPK
jgi:S-disulfanyl-L-cysteine oxidoreductase SoxD